MKALFIAVMFPVAVLGQTVHHQKNEIIYKGDVKLASLSTKDPMASLSNAVHVAGVEARAQFDSTSSGKVLATKGTIGLNAPFRIIRNLHFTLTVSPQTAGYNYQVDSVFVTEKRRGGNETVKKSKELLDGIEDTGLRAVEAEKVLNEIDMRLQKLLAVMKREMKKEQNK